MKKNLSKKNLTANFLLVSLYGSESSKTNSSTNGSCGSKTNSGSTTNCGTKTNTAQYC